MRRSGGVSNDVVEGRVQARLRSLHRSRLASARAVVGSGPGAEQAPVRYAHLDPATKAVPREARVRSDLIARDNSLLVDKMCHILARRPQANHDPALLAAARRATARDAYQPGPIPLPKSLNQGARTRKLEQIGMENEKFLNRLIASPGVLSRQEWERRAAEELRYLDLHCKFPYTDPKLAMPVVNPMLAIANAQSNKAAEMILRNQQALLQQQQQLLPHLNAAPQHPASSSFPSAGMGATHANFGASFGSTSSLPPMHNDAFARSMQPVPPHTARSASSAAAPAQPRLRAQYTSQGVRIIRTGRSGHSTARPSSSLDPLRHGALREPHKDGGAKFQPLRSQQLQQLKGGATSPTRNRLRDEHKEAQPASSSEGSSTQLALTAGDGASADSSSSDGSGSVSAALLFEDTLVISGRPVLVRVSELASPSRLEVRVFDPYSSLEYDLSLPLTFVRMCMYQVPDLLLQHNRKYLVQTLLHYLVFVQTDTQAGGNGGLELLVDIVAPPPRNAVEAAAWARVQEEAAIEQASWELDNEREAARARRELQRQQSHTQQQEQAAQSEQETEQKEQEQPLEQPEESDELTQSTEAQPAAAADGTEQPAGAATTAVDESTAPPSSSSPVAVSDAALTDSTAVSGSDSAQPAAASSSSSDSAIDK